MPHTPQTRVAPSRGAPEFQTGNQLQLLQEQLAPLSQQAFLRAGQFERTRRLSGAQGSELFRSVQQAQQQALLGAALQARQLQAREQQRERLITEQRQFRVRQQEEAREEASRQRRNALIGGILGAVGGPVGTAVGGLIGAGGRRRETEALQAGTENLGGFARVLSGEITLEEFLAQSGILGGGTPDLPAVDPGLIAEPISLEDVLAQFQQFQR